MNVLAPFDWPGMAAKGRVPPVTPGGEPDIMLAVATDLAALEPEWRSFEKRAAGTFYQSFAWCSAWLGTVGHRQGAECRVVTGRTRAGRLLFLLPLSLRRRFGCRILEWIGSAQISQGYGLYDRAFLGMAPAWFAAQGWRVLEAAGPFDAAHLEKMPEDLWGVPHPLTAWFSLGNANRSHLLGLGADFEFLYRSKRSAETRRGNKKRDAKLAACGSLDFGLPSPGAETHALLDIMFSQQQARLEEMGVFKRFNGDHKRFLHRLADLQGDAGPALLPYRLKIGNDVAVVMLGGRHGDAYWALISSLGDAPFRRHSPGDAALRRLIEACCREGLAAIDFGTGDTDYKRHWADRTVELYDAVRAVTARGYGWSLAALAALMLKRLVKRTPALWAAATWLRRLRSIKR